MSNEGKKPWTEGPEPPAKPWSRMRVRVFKLGYTAGLLLVVAASAIYLNDYLTERYDNRSECFKTGRIPAYVKVAGGGWYGCLRPDGLVEQLPKGLK